jgi:hypothetical protein
MRSEKNMRSISNNLKTRLIAEASEATFQGFDNLASHITKQAEETPIRNDEDEYVYSFSELRSDVEHLLWSAATRTQDYFGKTANATEIDNIIQIHADEFVESIRNKIGGSVIGPYEPFVPGEERILVEIEEND